MPVRTLDDKGGRRPLPGVAVAGALLGVTLAGATPARADCRDPFRNPDDILDFHLQTTSATWAAFQASEMSGGGCDDQYPYFAAQFHCGDDEAPIVIGFRRKRDRSETRAKLPIKLDFNREVSGQRWPAARGALGFRKLSLNSGMSDDAGRTGGPGSTPNPGTLSAILTEHLAWRLMRQELPEVSGVAYARLTIEVSDTGATQYQGLYILIEDIDRTAVRARFGTGADPGTLLKTTDLECVDQVEYDDGPPNPATDLFTSWLAEAPETFPGGWYARTDQAMHLDSLLRQEALRELLANTGDTVLGNRNNYFALDLRTDRRWYFPWDLDDMFRPFPQIRAPETALVHACTGAAGCTPNRIGQNIRDNPEIRRRYLEIMCQLSNGVAQETKLVESLVALDALVRPIIAAEVASVWAPLGRDPLNAAVAGTYAAEVERMKTWIPARIEAVRAMIRAEGVACEAGCAEGAVEDCEHRGQASRRVCGAGRWGACEDPMLGPGGAGGAAGAGGAGGDGGAGGASSTENGGAGGTAIGSDSPGRTCSSSGCSCALGGKGSGDDRGSPPTGAVNLVGLLLGLITRPARRTGRRAGR